MIAITVAGACLLWSAPCPGQTTRPAEEGQDPWSVMISELSIQIATGDVDAIRKHLAPGVTIRGFHGEKTSDLMDLTRLTTEATLVGARAYAELPKALADDVATDVAGASAVPEERKKSFLPGAGGDARRANEIAAQWVDKVLAPEKGQRIGVLIFWHSGETEASAGPIFVLIRGETDDDGVLRVTRVVYGNPLRSEQ